MLVILHETGTIKVGARKLFCIEGKTVGLLYWSDRTVQYKVLDPS